jgi:hypothetical protein
MDHQAVSALQEIRGHMLPHQAYSDKTQQLRHSFPSFLDGFVKSPSAALRFNFVVAEGRGDSPSRPISGNPAGCPYHRICAPCIWSFLRNHRLCDFLRDHLSFKS